MKPRRAVLTLSLVALTSCAGGEPTERTDESGETATETASTEPSRPTARQAAARAGDRVIHTQDVWIFGSIRSISAAGDTIELLERLFASVDPEDLGDPIDFGDGPTFRTLGSVRGRVIDLAGQSVPNISMQFGVLSQADTGWFAAVATPDIASAFRSVQPTDQVWIGLPPGVLEGVRGRVELDFAMAQALPGLRAETEARLGDLEVLARRWGRGDVGFLTLNDGDEPLWLVTTLDGDVDLRALGYGGGGRADLRFAAARPQGTVSNPQTFRLELNGTSIKFNGKGIGTHAKRWVGRRLLSYLDQFRGIRINIDSFLPPNQPTPDDRDDCPPMGPPLPPPPPPQGPPSGPVSGTVMPDGTFVPDEPFIQEPPLPPPPGCPTPPAPSDGSNPTGGGGTASAAGPGGGSGEPHMRFLDGEWYDLQAAGEFIAVQNADGRPIVQMRSEPWGGPAARAAVATALALDVAGSRVTITATDSVPIRIDGEPTRLRTALFTPLPNGGFISRYQHRIAVIWPDHTSVRVNLRGRSLDFYTWVPPDQAGRVAGLLGNADGEDGNDFVTRDGRTLPNPPDFETLYGTFAESWRIAPGESLFDYGAGESTETFTDRDFPPEEITLADLTEAELAPARQVCDAAGIVESPALEHCLYDVGLTGDPRFAASAAVVQALVPPEVDGLIAPREVTATSPFEVTYPMLGGGIGANDRVNLVPAGTPEDYFGELDVAWDSHMTIEGNPLRFWSPIEPGDYELRQWDVTAETILARRRIRVLPGIAASLDAPDEVAVGSVFQVGWSGPGHENDAIFLMEPGADPAITLLPVASAVVPTDGGPVELTAPFEPGVYELRYVYGGGVGSSLGRGAMVSVPLRVVAQSGIGEEGDFR